MAATKFPIVSPPPARWTVVPDPQSSVPAQGIPSCTPGFCCSAASPSRPPPPNCAETQDCTQGSNVEQGAGGCRGVRAGTGTPAHGAAPVQTGLSLGGLLDPAARNNVGFPPQGLGPGRSHGRRGGPEKLLPAVWDTDMASTPERDRVDSAANGLVGSSSPWCSAALVPCWPWACSHPPHQHHGGAMWWWGWSCP